jgi:hypothetical protein
MQPIRNWKLLPAIHVLPVAAAAIAGVPDHAVKLNIPGGVTLIMTRVIYYLNQIVYFVLINPPRI